LNSYHSVNSKKTNDTIKLLTVFSAFFLPLTFIVGIYGMNFENMPELTWKYGYFMALFMMVIISVFIFIWFRKRKII
jgi:magnesium transporter